MIVIKYCMFHNIKKKIKDLLQRHTTNIKVLLNPVHFP